MNKPVFTIGVTGMNAIDSPGSGVGVIRAIRESADFDVRIIGLVYESLEPGIYMEGIADKSYMIPYPSAGRESLLKRLTYIHDKEHLDLLIPNFDAELYNFISLMPVFKKMKIKTFLPSLKKLEAIDKLHLHEFGKKFGYNVPKTHFLSSISQIGEIEDDFEYPVVVKGKFYEAYIAHNPEQVTGFFHKLNAKWGLPVIIQEFIHGTEIDIAALGDGKGRTIGAIPMRKLYITDKGKAWSGIVIDDPALLKLTRKFTRDSRWKGGFELEIMRNEQEELYIMEINPRFPAWIYTTAPAGQNLPAALVNLAMGLPAPTYKHYDVGTMFVRYAWDNITHIREFEKISNYGER